MPSRTLTALSGIAVVALGMVGLAACGGDDGDDAGAAPVVSCDGPSTLSGAGTLAPSSGSEITVRAGDYDFVGRTAAEKGTVTFTVTNAGTVPHEMMVMDADNKADLPTTPEGKLDLAAVGAGTIEGAIPSFEPDTTCRLTVELAAGTYQLVCNLDTPDATGTVVNHFAKGMAVPFVVTK